MAANSYSQAVSFLDSGCYRFIVKCRVLGTQVLGNFFSTHTELDVVHLGLLHVISNDFASFFRTIGKGGDAVAQHFLGNVRHQGNVDQRFE